MLGFKIENTVQFTDVSWMSLNLLSYSVNGNNWNNSYFYQVFTLNSLNMNIIHKNLSEVFLKNLDEMNQLFDQKVSNLQPEADFWEDFLEKENSSCFIQVYGISKILRRIANTNHKEMLKEVLKRCDFYSDKIVEKYS